jgi:hypothetical protein
MHGSNKEKGGIKGNMGGIHELKQRVNSGNYRIFNNSPVKEEVVKEALIQRSA